jgi:MoxR-like ATPase
MLINLGKEHPIESLTQVVDGQTIPELAGLVWDVHVDETVRKYIVSIVFATRRQADLLLGASPRGSHGLYRAAQAFAAINGRDYVLPDDVKELAPVVLAHRCILHPESALRGVTVDSVISAALEVTPLEIGDTI